MWEINRECICSVTASHCSLIIVHPLQNSTSAALTHTSMSLLAPLLIQLWISVILVGVHKDVFESLASEVHTGFTEKTKVAIVFSIAGQLVTPSSGLFKNRHHHLR